MPGLSPMSSGKLKRSVLYFVLVKGSVGDSGLSDDGLIAPPIPPATFLSSEPRICVATPLAKSIAI